MFNLLRVVKMQAPIGHARPLLQLTLALIKPDAVAHPLILQAIHQKILDNNFIILKHKYLKWRQEETQAFYAEHSGRFFYQRVVEFMTSGPMRAYVLAREDAIQHWRYVMGPTKVYRARYTAPESIRGTYGLTDTRNTTHGSDSPESAAKEISFFFPEFKQQQWINKEEMSYRQGLYFYHSEKQLHLLRTRQQQPVQTQESSPQADFEGTDCTLDSRAQIERVVTTGQL